MPEQTEIYAAKIMTCPQCGATFLSTGTQTAGTCVYCRSTGAFESRMQPVPAPQHIIPFEVSKEDCVKLYTEHMRQWLFAPSGMRGAAQQEHFRGLYVPYWEYHITQQGESSLQGSREADGMDETLKLKLQIDAEYRSIFYDASEPFDDRIAEQIAPFYDDGLEPFSPEYLSGNYVAVADVAAGVYERSAKDYANAVAVGSLPLMEGYKELTRQTPVRFSLPEEGERADTLFHTRLTGTRQAMFPVWFLTWRRRNRVSYAVMNAQTGSLFADHPADLLRFSGLSAIFALPLFILLMLLPQLSARAMLAVSLVFGAAALGGFLWESSKVRALGYAVDLTEVSAWTLGAFLAAWLIVFLVNPADAVMNTGTVCCLASAAALVLLGMTKYNLTQSTQAPGTKRYIPAFLNQDEKVEQERIRAH